MTDSTIKKPVPTQHLRRVGVFVDEPTPGQFYWVIIESDDDASVWKELRAAEESFTSWFAAWEMGNKELLKMVVDKKTGSLALGGWAAEVRFDEVCDNKDRAGRVTGR